MHPAPRLSPAHQGAPGPTGQGFGLAVAVVLMAVASHYIARLLVQYPWITWIGLLIILWVAAGMIYQGSHEVTCQAFQIGCSEDLWSGILHRLGITADPSVLPAPAVPAPAPQP
jgi:hypothetical protein